MNNTVRNISTRRQTESETISDTARIACLLKQMSKHYSPLTVKIKGHPVQYSSCIVDVEKPFVLLDELLPASGHDRLMAEKNIIASGKLDGVDIRFNTTMKRVERQKNVVTYYMDLPESMEYHQRRTAYRVRIPMSKVLHVIIDAGERSIIVGELHDLSHGGAGKIVPDSNVSVKLGERYECAIELPDGEWLYTTVEMRYLKHIPSRKKQLIGAMFKDLSMMQSRMIGRCISTLELEEIRKRAAY